MSKPKAEANAPATLAGILLDEQSDLSAAARFARWHEEPSAPEVGDLYRGLIPLSWPQAGQQYAFEVDLDRCSGCKACVSACHSLNGLDEGEAWRETGLLVSGDWRRPYQQTVTTACHHCVEPACLHGCPVLAYDKDPFTGIVRHLDDQCIGCQYCVLKCPYDVPKYSAARGIVRKCDMCHQRLAVGEPPACVQACPNEAIRITVVDQRAVARQYRQPASAICPGSGRDGSAAPAVRALEQTPKFKLQVSGKPQTPNLKDPRSATRAGREFEGGNSSEVWSLKLGVSSKIGRNREWERSGFLPGSPAPDYTLPTTRYKSGKFIPDSAVAADREEVRPQPAHTPLVFMLVLSQLSVGLCVLGLPLGLFVQAGAKQAVSQTQHLAALLAGFAALAFGSLHLGRPLGAWRAFLGLRRSWLSREIVAFALYLGLAVAQTVAERPGLIDSARPTVLGWAMAVTGLAGVFCSAMVYHDTRRVFWHLSFSGGKFIGTTLLLGAAGTLLNLVGHTGPAVPIFLLAGLVALGAVLKLALVQSATARLADDDYSPPHKTALLLTGPLGLAQRAQIACGVAGGLGFPMFLAVEILQAPTRGSAVLCAWAMLSFLSCLAGEFLERRLFFLAVQPVKMPGPIAA